MICDPPYGDRVCSRKEGTKHLNMKNNGKGSFDMMAVYGGLMSLANKNLRQGGRLAFFFHTNEKKLDQD